MTEVQTIKVLELLNAFYAGGKNDPEQQVIAWHLILQNYDFDEAMSAVIRFAENDKRDYATFPAVGKIVEEIKSEARKRNNAISEIIRAVGYEKSYDTLSDDAKWLIPEESYKKWLDIEPEEFVANQNRYAEFLKTRRLQLEGSE